MSAVPTLVIIILSSVLIFLFLKYRSIKTQLENKDKELERSLYEIAAYKSVSSEVGYSLNLEKVFEGIIESINKAVPNSAITYAVVDNSTITLKLYENDQLSDEFIEDVKKITLDSFYESLPDKDYQVITSVQKDYLSSNGSYVKDKPQSFVSFPVTILERCAGIISLASPYKNIFSKEEKGMLAQIIENSAQTIEKIESIINTEKGKLDSFLFSLSSGAILFSIKDDILKISDINYAAKQFLQLEEDADTANVIAHFGLHYNLIKDIQEVALQKKSLMIKDVKIYDKFFKLYLNPVFLHNSEDVIGVALTMEDVTLEKDIEEMRETFVSMVVHELRAPLSSIKGASQMLMDGKLKREDAEKMLHIVHDSTERMLADIGDILDISKLEAGKFTLNKTVSNMNSLVKEKILTFSFLAQERKITLEQKLDEKILDSVFDQQRIGQVLNNLLSNALKFTPDNGTITATTRFLNDKIEVSVKDNGIGVSPEKMSLLFSKYGQFATSLRKEGGTGLGLYISRGIVDSHGGKIWLESKPKQGTIVTFEIPFVTKLEQPAQQISTSAQVSSLEKPSLAVSIAPDNQNSGKVVN